MIKTHRPKILSGSQRRVKAKLKKTEAEKERRVRQVF